MWNKNGQRKSHRPTSLCPHETARPSAVKPEASILGGGGAVAPNENIGVANILFCPPPPIIRQLKNLIIYNLCLMQECLKNTVRHYKTIKLNIRNTTKHTQFSILWRASRVKFYIATLPENFEIVLTLAPLPPSEKWIDAPVWNWIYVYILCITFPITVLMKQK